MTGDKPSVVVLAGPNGAGKTTSSAKLLKGALAVDEYVNVDIIAQGISGFNPDRVAIEASEIMLQRLKSLAEKRVSFGFETTLSSRSFAPWIKGLIEGGYFFHLLFLWLPSADTAVGRVAGRVKRGGHDVPEETIRRRYQRGLANFFNLYQPIASTWRVYDNSHVKRPLLIARGTGGIVKRVANEDIWSKISNRV